MDKRKFIYFLKELVTEKRLSTFENVLDLRTKYITLVLEDLFQTHNASAVIRSCDCFGVQDVHFIENKFRYNSNPDVSLGSAQWLNLVRHNKYENNTLDTINHLRKNGYRIIATTPHDNDIALENFDIEKGKFALFFGAELHGLSDIVLNNADEFLKINMVGFTESFNISVSAAICMYELTKKIRLSTLDWQLSQNEKDDVLFKWLMTSIKDSKNIVKLFCQRNNIEFDIKELNNYLL